MERWSRYSECLLHREHQLGLRFQHGSLFLKIISSVNTFMNLHFLGILDFQRFLKLIELMPEISLLSIRRTSLMDAISNWPFELSFEIGISSPWLCFGAESSSLIVFHMYSSKLLRGLLGWKSQSDCVWFHMSFTLSSWRLEIAKSLWAYAERGDFSFQAPFQKEIDSPLLIFQE